MAAGTGVGDPLIQPIRFDTAVLPPDEQLAAFAAYNPTSRITQAQPGPFAVRSTIWPLEEMILAQTWIDGMTATRDAAQVRAHPADHCMVIMPLTGVVWWWEAAGWQPCAPGALMVNDFSRPSASRTEGLDVLMLTVGRAFLEAGGVYAPTHGVVPASGETRLLIDVLHSLIRHLPDMRLTSGRRASRVVRDLLASAIAGTGEPASPAGRDADVRARVCRYLATLPPDRIDVAALPAVLGLSRSTLYRAFRRDGGVLAFDRRRRLLRLRQLLLDPAEPRGITELGLACGFIDMAALARLFRRSFGYTMRDLRRHATAPLVATADQPELVVSGRRYQALVSGLT